MSTPTSYVSQRDQMNARMATEAPSEVLSGFAAAADQLDALDFAVRAPQVGDQAADFALPDQHGEWCPHCNLQLRTFQAHLDQIAALGAQLVAVSPQTPDHSLSMAEKNDLGFLVLSDVGANVIDRYGLKYDVDAETRAYSRRSETSRRTQRTRRMGPPGRGAALDRQKEQMTVQGKTVLVTGGTSGIGEAIARAYAAEGADVVITGRSEERGRQIADSLTKDGTRARFVRADLEKFDDVQRLASEVDRVDVLVNDAGAFPFGPTHEVDSDVFDSTFALNVKAPFFLTGAFAPRMADNGGGAIVNVSTMVASFGMPGMALYGSTKAALELLTKAWAAEYGPEGVRVNAIAPGPTRTPGTEPMGENLDQLAATLPLGRPATPEEIANAALFLGSDEASYINGAVVAVDGGRTAT